VRIVFGLIAVFPIYIKVKEIGNKQRERKEFGISAKVGTFPS